MCNSKTVIEDEIHFLHVCDRMKEARDEYMKPMEASFEGNCTTDPIGFTRYLLQENNIKDFAQTLEAMFTYRKNLLLK